MRYARVYVHHVPTQFGYALPVGSRFGLRFGYGYALRCVLRLHLRLVIYVLHHARVCARYVRLLVVVVGYVVGFTLITFVTRIYVARLRLRLLRLFCYVRCVCVFPTARLR